MSELTFNTPRSKTVIIVDGSTLNINIDETSEFSPSANVEGTTLVMSTKPGDGRNHTTVRVNGTQMYVREKTWYQMMIDEIRKYIPFAYIANPTEVWEGLNDRAGR